MSKHNPKEIIAEIPNRETFLRLLKVNPGLLIIKLGATWCGPCKQINHIVHGFFSQSPPNVLCADIDVDVCFDFYSYLKSKKMVNGIPVLLCYKKGNENFAPDDSVTGSDPVQLDHFFKRCVVYSKSF